MKMTKDWDFYPLLVDDRPASIYVDLGAIDSAPNAELPHMAYIQLHMNAPREDGLSSQEEFDALILIEDALTRDLVGVGTDYVGRCTTNSCRDFYFYVARPQDWQSRITECMRLFPSYAYEADAREDRGWSTYLSYLYPSGSDRQTIENRRVCDSLERNGDKLLEAREIDHWIHFVDVANRDEFIDRASHLGFSLRAVSELSEDHNNDRYTVQVWRSDVPSFSNIDSVTLPLFNLAAEYGGEYDGWESIVVT
jgi:uncharacterized protein (TIGR01619 family)